jgi:hypothetical protein
VQDADLSRAIVLWTGKISRSFSRATVTLKNDFYIVVTPFGGFGRSATAIVN